MAWCLSVFILFLLFIDLIFLVFSTDRTVCKLNVGTVRRAFQFGQTYVVRPKGKHQATIVWLHGLGDNGNR